MPIVEIPDIGTVEFPDSMSREAITATIKDKILAPRKPTLRPQVLPPGETIPTVSRTQPIEAPEQAFPAREQALQDLRSPRPLPETPAPTEAQQQAMLTGVAQPEAEIQPIGKEGTLLRGASSMVAGILNRPEYLAAMANPATATAVGLRFAPAIAKQFFEDLGKAAQGDNEALGRAAVIGIPALLGGIRTGKTITERMNAQVQLERAQAASSAAHIDALSRAGTQGTMGGIEPPITMRPTPGRPSVLTPQARELTPVEAEGIFDLGNLNQQSNELLTQSAEELAKLPGERTSDARKISSPTEIYGSLRPQQEPAKPLPVSQGGAGIQPQAEQRLPGQDDTAAKETAQDVSRNVKEVTPSETQTQEKGQEILTPSPREPSGGTEVKPTAARKYTPAIMLRDGTVVEGESHLAILDDLKNEGKSGDWISRGFVTQDGRFLKGGLTEIARSEQEGQEPLTKPTVEPTVAKAAETITGGGGETPIQEGKASEIPAEPRRKAGRQPERPPDLIDFIKNNVGKLRGLKSSKPGEEGYYSEAYKESLKHGAVRELYSNNPGAQSLDSAVDLLRREGMVGKDFDVEDLHNKLTANAIARKGARTQKTREQGLIEKQEAQRVDFENVAIDNKRNAVAKQKAKPISVSELLEGDEFELAGAKVKVSKLHFDEDTGDLAYVELEDGKRFGVQTVSGDQVIYPDGGTLVQKAPSTEFLPPEPKEDFTLNKPESVEEQKARMAREAESAQRKAGQEKLKEGASKPLVGSVGDIGQKEMFGGGDLFSGDISVGPGAASPSDITKPGTVVSNMFAAIDRDRALNGKPPMEPGEPRTWDQDRQIATARMNRDPNWIPNLIQEVLDKPRPLTSWEQMGTVLQKAYWKAEANNALRRIAQAFEDNRQDDLVEARAEAVRFEDSLARMEEAVGRGGTGSEAGRTLQAQKIGLTDDLSLIEMRLEARARKGGKPLTEAESAKIEQIHKDYQAKLAALEKTAAESDRQRVEAETRATLAELGRQSAEAKVPPPHIQKLIQRVGDTIHTRAEAARERLRGKLFTLSPDVLRDLAEVGADNIWTIGEDFARWSVKMAQDIGEHVKPYLAQVWEASKKLVSDSFDAERTPAKGKKPAKPKEVEIAKQTIKQGDTPQQQRAKLTARIVDRFSKGELRKITPSVQKLARTFVAEGIRGRDELIDAVHGVLEKVLPNWDRRDTMDAISGYGDYKALSKDEVSVALRDLKGQMQQIAKLEDMAGGEAPLRTGLERREVTQAQQALIRLVNEAKRKGGYETTDPTTQLRTALDEVKKRTETQIAEYQRRLDEKDFSVRKLTPIKPDNELIAKQADLKRVRKQWDQAKREWDNANRKAWQKVLDKFVRWERAFKLSSPVVFGKLTAAALTRVATTLTEEAVGTGLRLVPGIRAVAKQAPREGGALNVSAFSKALAQAVTQGMKDAWQTARKGAADVDVQYGEKMIDRDWLNIFGQLHGMLKAPVKRLEIEYSLAKRIEFNLRHGVDVTDKMVMERLMAEAVNDGFRSIFMQRGFTSDSFNNFVGILEKSKKYPVAGEISARTLRFLLPIVRVPANIVAETSTGIYGAPLASARVLTGVIRGTLKDMKPEVADAVMRQFKKGSIGLGLMAIGFLNPQSIGGFDWREKRAPGSVKTAGFQVGGVDIPRWMTHAPWFELMQFGATIRHVADQHVAKTGEAKGIPEGLWAAGLGLVEETPLVNEMLAVDKLFNPYQRSQFLGEMLRGTLVPQAIQKVATMTDTDITGPIQRKASTVGEQIKLGIPGLRQSVPERAAP